MAEVDCPLTCHDRATTLHLVPDSVPKVYIDGRPDDAGRCEWVTDRVLNCNGPEELRAVTQLRFDLEDTDDDGVFDAGLLLTRICREDRCEGVFATLGFDDAPAVAWLAEAPVLSRPIRIFSSKAVDRDAVAELIAGDRRFALDPVFGGSGLIVGWDTFGAGVPTGVELVLTGGRDLAGNPVVLQPGAALAELGEWTENAGFELEGVNWRAHGVSYHDANCCDVLLAVQGERFAYFYFQGTLVGRARIPVDAPTLSFIWAVEGPGRPERSELVVVDSAGVRTVVWSIGGPEVPLCEEDPCIAWNKQTIDMSEWADQAVYLEFSVELVPFLFNQSPQQVGVGFAVDDLRFE